MSGLENIFELRRWMYMHRDANGRVTKEYLAGLERFMHQADSTPLAQESGKIFCPWSIKLLTLWFTETWRFLELKLCYGFFAFAVAADVVRDLSPEKVGKWVPLPMAMAVPFLVGGYFAVDMCVGSLIVFVWNMRDRVKAGLMVPAVASGLICGDGLWILPSSILALAGVKPPICMRFVPSK
uniref:Uncharacterized protein n=1 Tax=Brassica oleracea var. oleracea TaxID=109376 RepID=A0A0D3AMF5_BRAOL